MIEILSWAAMFLTVLGVFLLAKKKCSGWIAGIFSCVLWLLYSAFSDQPALAMTNFIILIFDIYGLYKWMNQDGEKFK
jgi:hypothetical protein